MSSPDDKKPSGVVLPPGKLILSTKSGRFHFQGTLSRKTISPDIERIRSIEQERELLATTRIEWLSSLEFDRRASLLLKEIEDNAPELAPAEPPSAIMLSLMMPAATSAEIIENMEDLYRDSWVPRYGKRQADWIWRWQVVQFVLWRWTWPVMSLLGALKLIKLG